jgi:hypothetical protein
MRASIVEPRCGVLACPLTIVIHSHYVFNSDTSVLLWTIVIGPALNPTAANVRESWQGRTPMLMVDEAGELLR